MVLPIAPRRILRVRACGLLLASALTSPVAAQDTAIRIPGAAEVSEATRRQAEGPQRWILMMEKLEKEGKLPFGKKPAAPAARPAATPAPAAPAPAAPRPAAAAQPKAPSPQELEALAAPPAPPAPAAPEPAARVADAPEATAPPPEPVLELVDLVEPTMPPNLRARLSEGYRVLVEFEVQPDGSVRGAQVLEASHADLRRPVLAAVSRWRYAPPGKAVTTRVALQVAPAE